MGTQWRESGVRAPIFQKDGPRDSHKNVIRLVGEGVRQKLSLAFWDGKQEQFFQGFIARFWVSWKCCNAAGRGINQIRMPTG